jgi:gamma-glutamyltranspeptidase/glutathione hydrolase
VPNAYGLVGGEANAIVPGKRMLSSMTPTFVESERGVALLGTPGGSRIITMVLQALLALDAGQGPARWVASPRLHLKAIPDGFGNMQAVYWDRHENRVSAASDPRGIGQAEVR